jgi:hypothetical protein
MRKLSLAFSLVVTSFGLFVTPARAQLITNGGFESPGFGGVDSYKYLAGSLGTANAITGWTNTWDGSGEASYWMRAGGPYDASIGAGSYGITLNQGDILSTTFSVVSGQTYSVSFLAKTAVTLPSGGVKVTAAGNIANFTPTATFNTYSFDFVAGSTGTVGLSFQLVSGLPAPQYANLDSVSVSAIPEPSTYAAIAGAAMLALGIWRKRSGRRLPRA